MGIVCKTIVFKPGASRTAHPVPSKSDHIMIVATSNISIHENELGFDFIRSSGPGGQNVNKVATAVQLRFDVRNSPSLPDEVRKRLISLAGKKVTEEGILILDARRHRSQERNRQDAVNRLMALIRKASEKPKNRKPTKPSFASEKRRLDSKRRRSGVKKLRKPVVNEE